MYKKYWLFIVLLILLSCGGGNLGYKYKIGKSAFPSYSEERVYQTNGKIQGQEEYASYPENPFQNTEKDPFSTFSIDVDTASYSNMRRFVEQERLLPPPDSIRIEEWLNYFVYHYPEPKQNEPFALYTEIGNCPWNPEHHILHIGLKTKKIEIENIPPMNLVFLIDVSGSMSPPNRLPLVKKALKMLVEHLRPQDKIAIVVYAGKSGLILPSTSANNKKEILQVIESLSAGGTTAGGEGLLLAYKVAKENFIPKGNNRIILATDGDFNVGPSSTQELLEIVERERKNGVFITVLGFGMGNLKDNRMELIADKGNGNYAYIDNFNEAKKVLINEIGSTLLTVAKDVKLQVQFNPAIVQSYRLIGYENRMLTKKDFTDDKKDAGDIGAGHSVTALYEIRLKSNTNNLNPSKEFPLNEIAILHIRYKKPQEDQSRLLTFRIPNQILEVEKNSIDFYFANAVAGLGLLLKNSSYKGNITIEKIIELAKKGKGEDKEGYREEFIQITQNIRVLLSFQKDNTKNTKQ